MGKSFSPLLAATAWLLLAGTFVGLVGCSEESYPGGLNSDLTSNSMSVFIMRPPYSGDLMTGPPLPDALITVHFVDMDHTDPLTDKYEVRAEGQGLTSGDGRWSCNRSYNQEGPEAADIVFVWVDHDVYGRKYETRLLNNNGRASLTIGMGL